MVHLGDICKINGAEIEPVWCITGGSPCQDLSIAGKRAGLAGARSGLFMEQVRIVKEMREADKRNGRTGDMVRPRYLVWENVVGAFSSNKGRDFHAVLEEIARIAEPGFSLSGLPEKWKWTKAGAIDGDGWSIAWRTHDAKDWGKTIRDSRTGNVIRLGTPQRRRRISVVADFGGESAAQIQFDRESVSGHPAESGTAGERPAGAAESCASYAVRIRGGCDGGGKGALAQTEKSGTIKAGNDQTLFEATPINLMVATRYKALGRGTGFGVGQPGDPANTISSAHSHGVFVSEEQAPICMATQQDCVMPSQALTEVASTLRAGAGAPKHDADIRGSLAISYKQTTRAGFKLGNNQPVICIQGNAIDRADTAGCNGKGWKEDVCYTLNTIDRPAVCAGPDCLTPWDCQSKRVYSEAGVMPTLQAGENSGQNQEAVLCAGFKLGNSEQARSIGYAEEQAPTLNAECGGNKPAVMCLNDQGGNVMGVSHDVSGTLRAQENGHQPSILDMSHACDVIRDCGEVAPSLQARMGTGGNQVPLTYQMNGFGDYRAAECASSCKQRDFKDSTDLAITHMVVRRLTPMECERLQGFPDHWTEIGEWIDEKGKKHKDADSPKYKALGNSIALPFWDWMLRRMARYLPEGATLGSLFDGISGFNVCWARIYGAECCRWSSEIEQFPISVTKKHFGDEEVGKEGDFEKFFGRNKKENV